MKRNKDKKINENKYLPRKNKYMSKEERQKLRRRKNTLYRINYMRLAILLFSLVIVLFLLIFGIYKAVSHFTDKNTKKTEETFEESKKEFSSEYKAGETSKKIEEIKSFLKNKDENFRKDIDTYLSKYNLDKNKINLVYSKITDDKEDSSKIIEEEKDFIYSSKEKLPLNNANIFIISMIAEDMERKGNLDLNTIVDLKEKKETSEETKSESEKKTEITSEPETTSENIPSKTITLMDLIDDMIIKPETWKIKLVLEYVEKAARADWKTYANKFYNLSINTQNEMPLKEIIDVYKLAFKKDNGQFRYRRTVDSLVKSSQANKDLYYIETNNFMGFIGVYEYAYTMEIAYIMGEKPYVYFIQTDYSDKSISTELRNIINNWHKIYN
ncbi:hypothetical protein [Helcococcus kunzii]|uniref:hypothetical protein n=1 Tax=Helcococcus kunzii TaxID=40091 RepID=UPI0021A6996E|nr:hypothetical protein [Helcococcus kunzii]MCT1795980.1 hypothetical protein [Helcococcus kunzii]MCT1988244.1 hypothetical protein [Helcococcus kunzii]